MAFGISPRFEREATFDDLPEGEILVLAIDAVNKLNWSLGNVSESGFVAYTGFSMSSWSEEVTVKIENKNVILKSECTGIQLLDWGKNKRNVEEFFTAFAELTQLVSPDERKSKYEELKSKFQDEDIFNQTPQNSRARVNGFFGIFIPTDGYFITPIIINLNILVFILMTVSGANIMMPDNESLITWGANFSLVTLDGQWWRLFSSCFVHIGIFHLLMNLYALLYIGLLLEPQLGKSRFLTAYILSGLIGSVASLYWNDLTISAGASGAIFGMYGVFLAMLTTNLIEKNARKTFMVSILIFVGYNLLNGLKGGVDNAAHIGGLVSGILIGYSFYPSLIRLDEINIKYVTIVLLIMSSFSLSAIVYNNTPGDMAEYSKKMDEFIVTEEMALEIYNMPDSTPKELMLTEIRARGIYYWNENIKIVNDIDKMNIPDEIRERNAILKEYCELRIKSYELIYKMIEEDNDMYNKEIEVYNKKIEEVIAQLQ